MTLAGWGRKLLLLPGTALGVAQMLWYFAKALQDRRCGGPLIPYENGDSLSDMVLDTCNLCNCINPEAARGPLPMMTDSVTGWEWGG